jgi:DNA-binding CsgD family transcriptional regulator
MASMRDTGPRAGLIGDIYDAALEPDGWPHLPQILANVTDGDSANVAIVHESGVVDAVSYGVPAEALARYRGHYYRVNPMIPAAIARDLVRHTVRMSDIMPDLEFQQTEFYFDFARVFDTVRGLAGGLAQIAPGYVAEIGIHRRNGASDFTSCHIDRLEALRPHVFRALQLRLRLGLIPSAQLGFTVLDALAIACIVCDAGGRILFANAAAEALATPGGAIVLGANGRGLGAAGSDEARRLAALIAETAGGGSGGAMVLTAPDGTRLFALVTPLPTRIGGTPGDILITLRTSAAGPATDETALRQLFGFTPAEARLALALSAGRSLGDIVAERGISDNTIRTQIASVLRKAGVANQRELVRMLGLLPPLRAAARRNLD